MKSIGLFEQAFYKALSEMNVAGGATSVFGTVNSGATGNAFPGHQDNYAPGDSRLPKVLGAGKKKKKFFVQRRPLPGLVLKLSK
jgi:hypothetical protein